MHPPTYLSLRFSSGYPSAFPVVMHSLPAAHLSYSARLNTPAKPTCNRPISCHYRVKAT